ncbi:MAG: hypothetical protein ACFFA3_08165 [Promethearchaeota archaeon]
MTKISKIPAILFLVSLIIGIILLIHGININIRVLELFRLDELHQYDPDWDPYDPWIGEWVAMMYIGLGTIIIIITVIVSFTYYFQAPSKVVEKREYMNVKWLNHQYNELERSLQDIAIDQGVSMITIKKWVDKLPNR